eukprot:TRINITY_DN38498_c0_g1_i1.p1 TRINITY_DN38498_c0_g1~~TRINITY_DN38498_c0_g1_i1.p1  ORF type:complete len:1251 (+),score=272.20 TRINITY_DN38498_c0_g1_i1:240-3992(+)
MSKAPTSRGGSKETGGETTCCVAWTLTRRAQVSIKAHQLQALHNEIQACLELVGAVKIETGATSGVLRCDANAAEGSLERVTAVDVAIRFGQLICRWGAEQEPHVGLKVGVHTGTIHSITLPPTQTLGYFGSAVSTARYLADSAPTDLCVHFLEETKKDLNIFELLPFSVTANGSYYLDPTTEAQQEDVFSARMSQSFRKHMSSCENTGTSAAKKMVDFRLDRVLSENNDKMTLQELEDHLRKHDVDVSQFGRGAAKSLKEFHQELMQHKSYIKLTNDNKVERVMELARIHISSTGSDGVERTLTLAAEINKGGEHVPRDQKLAAAVQMEQTWQEAVSKSFREKLLLSQELQDSMLVIESNWFKEQRMESASVPMMPTVYFTHEVRVRVKDPSMPGAEKLGLPTMKDFCTQIGDNRQLHWSWVIPGSENAHEDQLAGLLYRYNIATTEFGPTSFHDLVHEVYETKVSQLIVRKGELIRSLQIVKVWLCTDVLSVPHILVMTSKSKDGKIDGGKKDTPISMRMEANHTWEQGVQKALNQRLGLDNDFLAKSISVDHGSYRLSEETEYSKSYPGLKTVYRIHEVLCQVLDDSPLLGLPEGTNFSYTRSEASTSKTESNRIITSSFAWKPESEVTLALLQRSGWSGRITWKPRQKLSRSDRPSGNRNDPFFDRKPSIKPAADEKRRVPNPEPLTWPSSYDPSSGSVVKELMKDRRLNSDRAWNAARRIRDKDYSCLDFFEDCLASFPELALYMADGGQGGTTSGRSADDEYQRTIGALFAVYWLMRLGEDGDGAISFTFGVDENWQPMTEDSESPRRSEEELRKRCSFLENVPWRLLEDVLTTAGLLTSSSPTGHDPERTLAMLVLTAIHDIMKLQPLIPVVQAKHVGADGRFHGYKIGDSVNDHDLALAYLLEYEPEALPSFRDLKDSQKRSIMFTQAKMEYNMGWLVQAEAPPGALFRKFKSVMTSAGTDPTDVAFYFTHWLTDLAGAEPTPQEGCEKFVLKFPQKVLSCFLASFRFVQDLAIESETAVLEKYLTWRWEAHSPSLGGLPQGAGSVARLRLLVMAQAAGEYALEGYQKLSQQDRKIIDEELARTGCFGQSYERDELPDADCGPAFLVYYAPAFLHHNVQASPLASLAALSEVLRQARLLWPLSEAAANDVVTLRIDAMKDLDVHAISQLQPGEFWALQRTSDVDAQVKRMRVVDATGGAQNNIDWSSHRLLTFGGSLYAGGCSDGVPSEGEGEEDATGDGSE